MLNFPKEIRLKDNIEILVNADTPSTHAEALAVLLQKSLLLYGDFLTISPSDEEAIGFATLALFRVAKQLEFDES